MKLPKQSKIRAFCEKAHKKSGGATPELIRVYNAFLENQRKPDDGLIAKTIRMTAAEWAEVERVRVAWGQRSEAAVLRLIAKGVAGTVPPPLAHAEDAPYA